LADVAPVVAQSHRHPRAGPLTSQSQGKIYSRQKKGLFRNGPRMKVSGREGFNYCPGF
jgi:hypothetical protein